MQTAKESIFQKKIDSARVRSNQTPQYLQYLDKILDKTDVMGQNIKQLNTQVLVIEQNMEKYAFLQQNQEDLFDKIKALELMHVNYNDDQQLSKLLLDALQQKQKDFEIAIDVLSTQIEEINNLNDVNGSHKIQASEQIKSQKLVEDNHSLMKDVLLNIDAKIEAVVDRKLMAAQLTGIDQGSAQSLNQWNQKEQKIIEIIDNQGKDIAVDIAKLEEVVQGLVQVKETRSLEHQQLGQQVNLNEQSDFNQGVIQHSEDKLENIKHQIQEKLEIRIDQIKKELAPERQDDDQIKVKIKTLDQQFTQLQNQFILLKIDNQNKLRNSQLSNSPSKRATGQWRDRVGQDNEQLHMFMESLDDDLQNLEKRLHQEFNQKLSSTVDKLGLIIKKQETRLNRLVKRINQFNSKGTENVSRISAESKGRSFSHVSVTNSKYNMNTKDVVSRNYKANRDSSYDSREKKSAAETLTYKNNKEKLNKSSTQQIVTSQQPIKYQSFTNEYDQKDQSPIAIKTKKSIQKYKLTSAAQKNSQIQVQTSMNSFNILNKHYRTFSPVLSSTSKSVHNLMQTIKEDLGDQVSNSNNKMTIMTNMSKKQQQTVTSGQRSPTTTNNNLIASHRTNQNINNLKITTSQLQQQSNFGGIQPYAASGFGPIETDSLGYRVSNKRTNSIDLIPSNEKPPQINPNNLKLSSAKNPGNSSAKIKSRLSSKSKKTKSKIVNGKLMKDNHFKPSRSPHLANANKKKFSSKLKITKSHSLQRSQSRSKSPNTNQEKNPAGYAVPDPYARSRSNQSIKGSKSRHLQQSVILNNSLSQSTGGIDVNKKLRNTTSQMSFMSKKSKQIMKNIQERKSQHRSNSNMSNQREDKFNGYWRPTESSKRKSATRRCIEQLRKDGNFKSKRKQSVTNTESSDQNDESYKPLRVRESSSPQYFNKYDKTRERILDGFLMLTNTAGADAFERGSFIDKSHVSASPLRPNSQGYKSRDDKRSNSSYTATKGILKPSSQSGSIHDSLNKKKATGSYLGGNPLRINEITSQVTYRSHVNQELIDSGEQNTEKFNKDLNSTTNSSPYQKYPRQLEGAGRNSLTRAANNRSKSLKKQQEIQQQYIEGRDLTSTKMNFKELSDSNDYSNERSKSRSGIKHALDIICERNQLNIKDQKDIKRGSHQKQNINNKPGYQVIRDERGFKRRIEYPDDDDNEIDIAAQSNHQQIIYQDSVEKNTNKNKNNQIYLTQQNGYRSAQKSSNGGDVDSRHLILTATSKNPTNMLENEDDLCYSKSIIKGSAKGSLGPSTYQPGLNSLQNTESRTKFQNQINSNNNLKQSTPQFEDRALTKQKNKDEKLSYESQLNLIGRTQGEYMMPQQNQDDFGQPVGDRTLALSHLDPSSLNYGSIEKRVPSSDDKKVALVGSSRLFPLEASNTHFGGGSSMFYGAQDGHQNTASPQKGFNFGGNSNINVQLGDSQLQHSQLSHIQNSANQSSINENRSVQMKATNERLAKLEQMYEELTILEQQAAAQNAPDNSQSNNQIANTKQSHLKKSSGRRIIGAKSSRTAKQPSKKI